MLKRHKNMLSRATGAVSLLTLFLAMGGSYAILSAQVTPFAITDEGAAVSAGSSVSVRHDPFIGQASKLRSRLLRESLFVPPTGILRNALRERQELFARSVTVQFDAGTESPAPWTVSLADRPEWLTLATSLLSARFTVDAALVEQTLRTEELPGIPWPSDAAAMNAAPDAKGVLRVAITGAPQRGYTFDPVVAAQTISRSLQNNETSVTVPAGIAGGGMTMLLADGTTKTLQLLAVGQSDFAKSPAGRIWNIEKAMKERLNGIVIPPGTEFSFNDALDPPITLKKGWKEALGLFGGGTAMTPGGGICQAATTTYRSALLAGFPIKQRKSHSMFVTYYEKGGVGIDATIFPGQQNLTFVNDSAHELVMTSDVKGTEAFVRLYGVPDGRKVVVEGPYFSTTKERPTIIRPLAYDQIAWIRRVEHMDGRKEERVFLSTYFKGIPSKVKKEYAVTQIENVHAAAPSASAEAPLQQSATDEAMKDRT